MADTHIEGTNGEMKEGQDSKGIVPSVFCLLEDSLLNPDKYPNGLSGNEVKWAKDVKGSTPYLVTNTPSVFGGEELVMPDYLRQWVIKFAIVNTSITTNATH